VVPTRIDARRRQDETNLCLESRPGDPRMKSTLRLASILMLAIAALLLLLHCSSGGSVQFDYDGF
jgi:hypothetical protein